MEHNIYFNLFCSIVTTIGICDLNENKYDLGLQTNHMLNVEQLEEIHHPNNPFEGWKLIM